MYASGWSSSLEDPTAERNRNHLVALAEARLASETQARDARPTESIGRIERLRRAMGIAPAEPECIACPA